MSTEVEILCTQKDCGLLKPYRIAVVKDQMYIIEDLFKISIFEGTCMSSDAFNSHFTKQSKFKIVLSTHIYCSVHPFISSGGLSQDSAGSGQNRVTAKNKFAPGRVTAQCVILLFPSLINNIYVVICIVPIPSYLKL